MKIPLYTGYTRLIDRACIVLVFVLFAHQLVNNIRGSVIGVITLLIDMIGCCIIP